MHVTCFRLLNKLSHVLVTNNVGFGLVIGLIDQLQVVTAVNYNTLSIAVIIKHK
jgi:hypothetical protein